MAGHSKWSKVKHIKGVVDARRGKLFSRLAKEITLAAKTGGGDPASNPRLRTAITNARAQNMPGDNIERAIKRGTGAGDSGALEETVYEGYAPGGVAVLVEVATDNKNRTTADLRHLFGRHNGNLASSGSVAYLFKRQGEITVAAAAATEDRLLELALEAGADELTRDAESYTITTAPDRLYAVGEALRAGGVEPAGQKLVFTPVTTVPVHDPYIAQQVIRLCEALEENDDVQGVHANFDIPEELLARLAP